MLTILVTGGSLLLAGLFFWIGRSEQLSPQSARLMSFFTGTMMLTSAVTGILCLVLTVAVHRIRRDRPPLAITVTAVFVSALPLATILLLALRG